MLLKRVFEVVPPGFLITQPIQSRYRESLFEALTRVGLVDLPQRERWRRTLL